MRLATIARRIGFAPLLLATIRIAQAQSTVIRGTIDGVVTDTSLAPLSNATVSILGSNIRVVTGTNGRFRIVDVPPGAHTLLTLRLGFQPLTTRVLLSPAETLHPAFTLVRAATALGTVSITGKQLGWRMTEFDQRRKLGEGQFMTQDEIEKRNVVAISDLLATFKIGKRGPSGMMSPCRFPAYFLDGIRMPPRPIDEVAIPRELAGIEVYVGAATIPLQYKPTSGGSCGVILLWTRVGN